MDNYPAGRRRKGTIRQAEGGLSRSLCPRAGNVRKSAGGPVPSRGLQSVLVEPILKAAVLHASWGISSAHVGTAATGCPVGKTRRKRRAAQRWARPTTQFGACPSAVARDKTFRRPRRQCCAQI